MKRPLRETTTQNQIIRAPESSLIMTTRKFFANKSLHIFYQHCLYSVDGQFLGIYLGRTINILSRTKVHRSGKGSKDLAEAKKRNAGSYIVSEMICFCWCGEVTAAAIETLLLNRLPRNSKGNFFNKKLVFNRDLSGFSGGTKVLDKAEHRKISAAGGGARANPVWLCNLKTGAVSFHQSQKAAANSVGVDKGGLSRTLSTRCNSSEGFFLSFNKPTKQEIADRRSRLLNKSYNFINKDGQEFIGAQSELVKKFNLNKGNISGVCSGARRSHGGWFLAESSD
jgi:predicted GIY-YIG superfamily endonuclease